MEASLPLSEFSGKSPEDKIMAAMVLNAIIDYARAVAYFGPKFYELPIPKQPYKGLYNKKKKNKHHEIYKAKTLAHGRLAFAYIFGDKESELGFMRVCDEISMNARLFRRKLRAMSQDEAKELVVRMLDEEKEGVKEEKNEENEGRV